jgi:hypothetical protein
VKRAFVLAASLLLLVSACGSSRDGSIPAPVAKRLAAESETVAAKLRAGDGCAAAALARRLHRDIVSAGLPLGAQAAARGLAEEIVCVPPAAAPAATTPAPVVQEPADDGDSGHGRGHEKHDKPKKHGKHDKHGDKGD